MRPESRAMDGPQADTLGISPILARILSLRGLTSTEDIRRFLCPNLSLLKPLEEWPGLLEGARSLAMALEERGALVVWGDYDVDGVTATALVRDFCARRGVVAKHFLPCRDDGYGLSVHGIENLAEAGAKVLLTVDCGTNALEPIARAKELGLFVAVTDHHAPGPELPPADVLINPLVLDWPSKSLAGVGVVFFLAAALNRLLPGPVVDMRQFLDLVALGTVADVVSLKGQNRILVKNGQLLLKDSPRPGIRALKRVCGMETDASVGTGSIGFGLAPRLNAAGRLDDPEMALDLILSEDEAAAGRMARKLDVLNSNRRAEEARILDEARVQAMGQTALGRAGFVLYGPDWHQGVIGIVASRIVEEFHVPTIVLTANHEGLKGSGRSAGDFDLFQGLTRCSELLTRFGGHRHAAGCSLPPERLEAFEGLFSEVVLEQLGRRPGPSEIVLDMALPFQDITPVLLDEIELMQPFGPGNPRPVFRSGWLEVRDSRLLGRDRLHLGLTLRDPECGTTMQAQFWRAGPEWTATDLKGHELQVAFCPQKSNYEGLMRIQLTIKAVLGVRAGD
ncbi:MAG: single-stranded-DNA-specific exonuclease RecJ [Deltaproteobacteria bacterium]|nr:single-stranded-DNA-specific exonuclease RecJ [Deltaproteobacteria bacterium]